MPRAHYTAKRGEHVEADRPPAHHAASRGVPRRSRIDRLLRWGPVGLVLLGVLVLLYPVVATQHNNAEQQRMAEQYGAVADSLGADVVAEQLAAAEQYNSHLASMPILDPWIEEQRPDTPQYQDYLAHLNLNPVMSRVTIPDAHIDLPIYHGTEHATLAKGVGHLFGTALPVGGTSTHAVLTGHTGLETATLFDNLRFLEMGDVFYVETLGRTLKYRIISIEVVLPEDTDSLIKQPGRDLVTLITCTPYGVNSHRLLVTGERVPVEPTVAAQEQQEAASQPMPTWMTTVLILVAVILAVLVTLILRAVIQARKRRRTAARSQEVNPPARAALPDS